METKLFIDKEWSLGIEDLTWDKVLELALQSPIIYNVFTLMKERGLSAEQALIAMVILQNHAIESTDAHVKWLMERSPGPVFIPKD